MSRSAPVVDAGTPTRILLSLRYVDAVGDITSTSVVMPAGITGAQIDAYVNAAAAATNADLYEVVRTEVFGSVPSKGNAATAPRMSVDDKFYTTFKNPAGDTVQMVIPSPIAGVDGPLDTDTETPLPAGSNTVAATVAFAVVVGNGLVPAWSGFTEHLERNQKVTH